MKESTKDYLQTEKFIRDLVHGYVYITRFEREIIDTVAFQRLKDVRQLTCQHVYPAARHTRFEHSLGVLELTRQALKHLNNNGFIHLRETDTSSDSEGKLLSDNLVFNGTLAALLHDVGHCPFSHLGETMFDEDEVNEQLFEIVTGTYTRKFRDGNNGNLDGSIDSKYVNDHAVEELRSGTLAKQFKAYDDKNARIPGATHEKISCIVIVEKFYKKLKEVENSCPDLKVDFELLFRCILGIEYDVSPKMFQVDENIYNENRKKNVIVNLINSKIFDMDKLDYIMRDACMTGIGTPSVDTKRLFRNMYLSEDFTLVFTNRAVPALQNMIEARDGLYMYVYNHHAVVYSDFMNSYIFRRMDHNYRDYQRTLYDLIHQKNDEINEEDVFGYIENLCFIPKSMIFSVGAVLDDNRSDSDMVSLLNMQYQSVRTKNYDNKQWFIGKLAEDLQGYGISLESSEIETLEQENINSLAIGIDRTFELLEKYLKRDYLKPWWKTNFEFNNFINKNFTDDKVRTTLCQWVCNKKHETPEGAEFRSQLAKHVCYITQDIYKDQTDKILRDGDFFIVQRPTSFFSPDAIKKLDIALKKSEILGSPNEVKYQTDSFYIKELTNIIPQRGYDSFYSKNSFYIYSKKLTDTSERNQDYYLNLEKIFVFVATSLIKKGEAKFQANFAAEKKVDVKKIEDDSKKEMLQEYYNVYPNDKPKR